MFQKYAGQARGGSPQLAGVPDASFRGGVGDGGAGSLEPAKIAAPIPFRALARVPKAVDFITLTIFEASSSLEDAIADEEGF